MKKTIIEIFISIGFVFIATSLVYSYLKGESIFWNAQSFWSMVLMVCWILVASGYYHQGWLVRRDKSSRDVSIVLPITVFLVQCILFIKGIYYKDWSLIFGALVVNSGVLFSLYQIIKNRNS